MIKNKQKKVSARMLIDVPDDQQKVLSIMAINKGVNGKKKLVENLVEAAVTTYLKRQKTLYEK